MLSCLNLKRDLRSYCKDKNLELQLSEYSTEGQNNYYEEGSSPQKRPKQVHNPNCIVTETAEDSRNSIVIKNLDRNGNFEKNLDRNGNFEDKEDITIGSIRVEDRNVPEILNLKERIILQVNANDQMLPQFGNLPSQNYQTCANSSAPPYHTSGVNSESLLYQTSNSFQSNEKYTLMSGTSSAASSHSSQTDTLEANANAFHTRNEFIAASASNNFSSESNLVLYTVIVPETLVQKFETIMKTEIKGSSFCPTSDLANCLE